MVHGSRAWRASAAVMVILCGSLLWQPDAVLADSASVSPSFYSEPGFHDKWRQKLSSLNENIDPFSGSLHLSHTDLVVPGTGGLDIRIQRHYTSNIWLTRQNPFSSPPVPTTLLPSGPTGVGWTMHFGRVVKTAQENTALDGICETDATNLDDTTQNNAVLELPNGSQDILLVNRMFSDSGSSVALFSTKKGWVANCMGSGEGLFVYSADGLRYTMNHVVASLDEVTYTTRLNRAWYPTKIEDGNGNYLAISYSGSKGSHALISQITASDGRIVIFGYTNGYLTSISANNQTWTYEYVDIGSYKQMARVTRPDGLTWQYSYYPSNDPIARYALQTVTYPYGATVGYSYAHVDFSGNVALVGGDPAQKYLNVVVASKNQTGRDIESGTWTYTYAPGADTVEPGNDVTAVDFPGGRHVYKHYGIQRQLYISGQPADRGLWRTGLLREKTIYNGSPGSYTQVHKETYEWQAPGAISYEKYTPLPYDYADLNVYFPQLVLKTVERDGTIYRTEFNYDCFLTDGTPTWCVRPKWKRETGQVGSVTESSRQTDLSWYPIATRESATPGVWLFDQVVHEIVDNNNSFGTLRSFDYNTGNMTAIQPRGVVEGFTYHANGNIATKQNANGWVWQFNDYHRGVPRLETHPITTLSSFTVTRQVNDTGTVSWETNGRSYTTSYQYDNLNRPTSIVKPTGAGTIVSWDAVGRTVSRGNYQERTYFDGFGSVICVDVMDVTRSEHVTRVTRYNALGHKIFESHPFSGTCPAAGSPSGDSFTTDVLGRITGVSHADGTSAITEYLAGNQTRVTNERGKATTYSFRSFGDPDRPDEKALMRIDAPENVTTVFTRNVIGQIQTVRQGYGVIGQELQGGVMRSYSYDPARNHLLTETNPETGTTTYTRDAIGNMKSRSVGGSGITTYDYDAPNRLRFVVYPGSTETAGFEYDNNNNLTLQFIQPPSSSADGVYNYMDRLYTYDPNDNLKTESLETWNLLVINGNRYVVQNRTLSAQYGYTELDQLTSITYPSSKVTNFNPDALGRPRQVAPFVTNVDYYPNGQPSTINYANGRTTTLELNNRQWVSRISTPAAGGLVDLTYVYDGRGNVSLITDNVGPYSRTLGYDGIDRLTSASGNWGSGSFSYDEVGNLKTKSLGNDSLSYTYDFNNRLASIGGSRNYNFTYDVYGNVAGNGSQLFTYDNASNLRSVTGASNMEYVYDGKNMRTRESDGTKVRYYFYAKHGELLGEYDRDNLTTYKEYNYLAGKLIGQREPNQPPIANAGADQTVNEGSVVTLVGSGMDTDGTITSYVWTQTAGPVVTLSGASTDTASFSAPQVTADTVFTFSLIVTDNQGDTGTDTVSVTVRNLNFPPTANAGVDQIVNEGSPVTLTGMGTDTDGTIVAYAWTQTAGPAVALANAGTATASFIAPAVSADTVLTFNLTATDNQGATGSDAINVTVRVSTNQPPIANAGPNRVVYEGQQVTLSGSGSDPDGTVTSFSWAQTSGPAVTLNGAASSTVQFVAPQISTDTILVFQLTVTDNLGASAASSVTVTVRAATTVPAAPAVTVTPGNSQNMISWNLGQGVTSNNLYWSTSPGVTRTTGTLVQNAANPYIQTGLQNGTVYYYVVTALNEFGESAESAEVSAAPGINQWGSIATAAAGGLGIYSYEFKTTASGAGILVWPQNDSTSNSSLWARWVDANGVWQDPERIAEDNNFPVFSFPRWTTTVDISGHAIAVWKSSNGTWYASRRTPDGSWSAKVSVPLNNLNFASPFIDSNGNAILAWIEEVPTGSTPGYTYNVKASRYEALTNTWGAPSVVETYIQPTSNDGSLNTARVVGENVGSAMVFWIASYGYSVGQPASEVHVSRFDISSGQWQAPFVISSGFASGLGVASDRAGRYVIVWSDVSDNNNISVLARRYTIGAGWAPIEQITTLPIYYEFHDFSVAIQENIDPIVVWSRVDGLDYYRYGIGDHATVYASRYVTGSGWTAAEQIGDNGYDSYNPNPRIANDPQGIATVLWGYSDLSTVSGASGLRANTYVPGQGWIGQYPVNRCAPPLSGCDLRGEIANGGSGNAIAVFFNNTNGPGRILQSRRHTWIGTGLPSQNRPPVVYAGPGGLGNEGETLTLYGAYAYDPDGSVASYAWTQLEGPAATINNANTLTPGIVLPQVETGSTLVFGLTVTDNQGDSTLDLRYFLMADLSTNTPPTANAGAPQTANPGATVTLNGSGSDPGGYITAYLWTQTAGPAVSLSNPNVAKPTFTAPAVSEDTLLTFQLTVTDNNLAVGRASVNITVQLAPVGRDLLMTAVSTTATQVNRGQTFTIANTVKNQGATNVTSSFSVRLYLSTDPTITTGDAVLGTRTVSSLNAGASNSATTTVTMPTSMVPGTYYIGAIADYANTQVESNETNNAMAGNTIEALNSLPTANAGLDQTVNKNTVVTLAGSGNDSDGTIASYAWTQTAGPAVTLTGANTATATFTAPDVTVDTVLTFRLTVTDNNGASATDDINVTVRNVVAASFPQVASITASAFGTNTTAHAVTMPATVSVGDLLLMLVASDGNANQTTPSGWTALFLNQRSGTAVTFSCYIKVATGTEGGTTVNVATSANEQAAAQVYRITGWFGALSGVVSSTSATGTSASPNPPSLTPSWGAANTLWLATHAYDHDATRTTTAYPANYTNGLHTQSNTGANAVHVASARRALNASSENPGAFTVDVSDNWVARTIAIRPAP